MPKDLYADNFSTFSGEIERVKTLLEIALAKAFAALLKTNESMAIIANLII